MPPSHRVAVPILVLLLLLVATEMGTTKVTVAEDRDCVSQSQRFKGVCISNNNCANTCNIEGFPEGECKYDGPNRKCYCKKKC